MGLRLALREAVAETVGRIDLAPDRALMPQRLADRNRRWMVDYEIGPFERPRALPSSSWHGFVELQGPAKIRV
jgi:hypothetical protein